MAVFRPFSAAYLADPYPFLARLRESEPVHRSIDLDAWVVTRHADVLAVLTDDDRFSSDPVNARGRMGDVVARMRAEAPLGHAIILGSSDPPGHTRLRAIVNAAFTPRRIAEFEPELEAMASDLVRSLPAGRPFDVVPSLAEPLAVISILAFIGVPPAHVNAVRGWSQAVMAARSSERPSRPLAAAAAQARDEFARYLVDAPEHSGVLAVLMEAARGERLSLDEVMMLVIHITTAGNGPAAYAIGNALLALADHPEQFKRIRDNPASVPNAVEEVLRWDSPVQAINRFVREPHEFAGRKFRAGDSVLAMVGAANRDPAVFADPDAFDSMRAPGRLLSFGQGIHFCLGAPLARVELAVVLRTFLDRFSAFRVLPPGAERAPDLLVRGPRKLVIEAR